MRIPSELPSTEVLLRFLTSKQGRRTKEYRPLTKQEIIGAAGDYASEFGYSVDEALYRYCVLFNDPTI